MAESAWKSQGKQRSDTATRTGEARKNVQRAVQSNQTALLQALLAGVSPEYLPGLLEQRLTGLPNSLLLDLLDRQSGFRETPVPSLPAQAPNTEPFVWPGPLRSPESGAANALPAPMGTPGAANALAPITGAAGG